MVAEGSFWEKVMIRGQFFRAASSSGVVAVQVHAGGGRLGKDPQLGGEVVLKIGVLNGGDVVHADVQKHGGGKLHVLHPVILQGLAGDLHGQIPDPRPHRVGKVAFQVQGLRGGEVGLELFHPVVGLDGGDHPAGGLPLGGQVLVKDVLEVVGRGGLALGAGDPHHPQLGGGVVVVEVGQVGHGQADVADQDAGQVHLVILLLCQVDEGPLLLGRLQKLHLEVGPLADEQGAGDHLAGVTAHQSHLSGERGAGEVQLQILSLQQLKVIPQGIKGEAHNHFPFYWTGT